MIATVNIMVIGRIFYSEGSFISVNQPDSSTKDTVKLRKLFFGRPEKKLATKRAKIDTKKKSF